MSSSDPTAYEIQGNNEYLKNAQKSLQERNYLQASDLYRKALETNPRNPELYLLKSQASFHIPNFSQALRDINEGLTVIEESGVTNNKNLLLKIRLLNMRSRVYKELQEFASAQNDAETVKTLLQQNELNGDFSQILSLDQVDLNASSVNESTEKREFFSAKDEESLTEKEQEVQAVYDLIQKSMDKGHLTTEFNLVHVVSMKWFDRWKKYTNFSFDSLNKPATHSNAEHKNSHDSHEGLLKEDFENVVPGPIDSDDILDNELNISVDPDLVKEYCNYALKQGLVENKDFIILPHPVWKYLHGIYAGRDIKRYVISLNDESNQTAIEVWLKRINVLVYPPIKKGQDPLQCQVQTLFMSKKETVKELREKMTRISKAQGNLAHQLTSCRLWKLDPHIDWRQFIQRAIEEKEEIYPIKGTRLTEGLVLEDAELGDTDVVICEYKQGKDWLLMSEEDHVQLLLSRCANCGKKDENLPICECKTVKYCDAACQKTHRPVHKDKCIKIKHAISKNNEIMKQFKLSKSRFASSSRYGICGLQNLGNTCFMNSSLQCLSHVNELTYYFLDNHFIKDLNSYNRLGTGGKLAAAYAELMKELWHGTDNYVSPWDIKKIIAEKASQFSGYNQQDAAEFLSYLVDGLHEDLNKVIQKPYVETIESDNRPDEIVAQHSWDNHQKRNQSIIVDLMHGQFKSKLVCPDCSKISITFDPFMTISLPIPHKNYVTLSLYFIYKDNKKLPDKITLTLDPTASAINILEKLSQLLPIPEEAMELCLIKGQVISPANIHKFDVKTLKDDEGMSFVYQTHNQEFDGPLDKFLEKSKVKVEVRILKEEDDEPLSFSRLVHVPTAANLKDLHHQVYLTMRGYLANVYNYDSREDHGFYIDPEECDLAGIEKEYKEFKDLGKEDNAPGPYVLEFVHEAENGKEESILVPYIENKQVSDLFPGIKFLSLNLVFRKETRTQGMKINKCQEFENTNSVPKEQRTYSLYDCFDLFTKPEILDQENLWYCSKCKEHKQATKKMDVYKLPSTLILHLKRFKTSRVHSIGSFYFSGGSSKITTLIDFPIEGLDLSRYTLGKYDDPPIYDLFAITNHYGSLGGGHYTAYAKNPLKNKWYDFNDSSVSVQDPSELVTGAGYLLFYKRRETEKQ